MRKHSPKTPGRSPRQTRLERWAAYTAERRRPARPRRRFNSTILWVSGLLVLQLLVVLSALLIVLSGDTRPVALAPSPSPTVLPSPTASPTATATRQPVSPPTFTPTFEPTPVPQPPTPTPTATPGPAPMPQPTASPIPLKLRGVEITQGIQVFNEPELPRCRHDPAQPDYIFCNNSIPLVAGRHTLVRVYPACAETCPTADVTLQLRLLKNGLEQARLTQTIAAAALPQVSAMPMPDLRLNLNHSLNFEFSPPPDWLTGQVTFVIETISPDQPQSASILSTLTQEFAIRKPLRVAYLPITYQGLRPTELVNIDQWLLRMYPVPAVEYYHLPVPDMTWEGDLNKGEVLRRLYYTYWLYTQNQPAEAWPDQLFGWLPQEIYNGGASDPYWCPNCTGSHSSRIAFGGLRPEADIGGPRILAHEIAHNLGALHAWSPTQSEDAHCFKAEGADISVDPDWPYPQTPHIQEFGLDLYSQPPVIYPPEAYDMMAYCAYPWISPHTYRKLFNSAFLQPGAPLPLANFNPPPETNPSGTLLVSGLVYADGTASQPEITHLDSGSFAPPAQFDPPPGDDYCLEAQAADGSSLAHRCFAAGFVDLETGQATDDSSPYFLTLPNIDPQQVAQISLTRRQAPLVTLLPSLHAPTVSLIFPNGGESLSGQQTITWQAADEDGDPLRFDLLYSPDGGQNWLPLATHLAQDYYTFSTSQIPAGPAGLIRVLASDGFYTTPAESNRPFTVEPLAPNTLSLLGPAQVKAGQTFEVILKANQLAEPGLFGLQFKLNFNPAQAQVEQLRLAPALSLVVNQAIDNPAGQVSIVASRQGQTDNLTGDLILTTFTFTAAAPGPLQLNLSDLTAGARGGLRLEMPPAQAWVVQVEP